MAEFGAEATSLSSPKGAGAEVIKPVMDNTGSEIVKAVSGALDIFQNIGKKNQASDEADIRKRYTTELGRVNSAFNSGKLSPKEADVRRREVYSQYAVAYPDFQDDFDEITTKFVRNTALSDADKALEADRQRRSKQIDLAVSEGYLVPPGASKQTEDEIIELTSKLRRNRQEVEEFRTSTRFAMEQGRYTREETDRLVKQNTIKTLNLQGATNIELFTTYIRDAVDQVSKSPGAYESVAQQLSSFYGRLRSQVQAAAGMNPELAGQYESQFADMYKTAQTLIDPNKKAENAQAQYNQWLATASLRAANGDQQLAGMAVMNKLGGNVVQNLYTAGDTASRILTVLYGTNPNDPTQPKPQVVGTPDGKVAIDTTIKNLNELNTVPKDKMESTKQALGDGVSNVLGDLGKQFRAGTPLNEKQVQDVVNLINHPKFLELRKEGKISEDAITAASIAAERLYTTPVLATAKQRLLEPSKAFRGDTKSVKDYIEIVPTTTGLTVRPKFGNKLTDNFAQRAALDARLGVQAISQIVQMEANLNGNGDVKATWERAKSDLLPEMFPPTEGKPETKKAPGSYRTEADMREQVKGLPSWDVMDEAEKAQIRKVIEDSLKRTDLQPAARKQLEEDLRTFK